MDVQTELQAELQVMQEQSFLLSQCIQVVRKNPDAILPHRGSNLHVYYKIYAPKSFTVPARGRATIDTGLMINVCGGNFLNVYADKGMADRGLLMSTHSRCCDCQHPIELMYFNMTGQTQTIPKGACIARFNVVSCVVARVRELEDEDDFVL